MKCCVSTVVMIFIAIKRNARARARHDGVCSLWFYYTFRVHQSTWVLVYIVYFIYYSAERHALSLYRETIQWQRLPPTRYVNGRDFR